MPVAFSDLRVAAYCPRKCYYRQREPDREPPPVVGERRDLAFRYPELLAAEDAELRALPIETTPQQFRANVERARERLDRWEAVANPAARNVFLSGRECHGIAHKVLADPPAVGICSPGDPPPAGVWEPHAVQAVAATKALEWERGRSIETAVVEYPAHGVVRTVDLTTRRTAAYRETLRAVERMDGPPSRVADDAKCEPCEYRTECGVRSRSLRSLLGD